MTVNIREFCTPSSLRKGLGADLSTSIIPGFYNTSEAYDALVLTDHAVLDLNEDIWKQLILPSISITFPDTFNIHHITWTWSSTLPSNFSIEYHSEFVLSWQRFHSDWRKYYKNNIGFFARFARPSTIFFTAKDYLKRTNNYRSQFEQLGFVPSTPKIKPAETAPSPFSLPEWLNIRNIILVGGVVVSIMIAPKVVDFFSKKKSVSGFLD